jgi:DNA ligase (NAD+)
MDIEHLGDAVIDQLVDRGLVKDFGDLYTLRVDQLAALERLADRSAHNLHDAIQGSKERGLARLLNALGIRLVGERVAHLLARRFGAMERLAAAPVAALGQIHGVGAQIAESVRAFFADETNRHVIDKLRREGVDMTEKTAVDGPRPLEGKTFVLTGTLGSLSRDQARERIQQLGGRVVGTVSRKTDYVVVGEAPGSKADDARRLGVPVLDEAAFLALTAQA